jgi:hypothetical protein
MDVGEVGWGDEDWIGLAQIGTGGELLWIRYWTFGFHKMLGSYPVASRVVLSSTVSQSGTAKQYMAAYHGEDEFSVSSTLKITRDVSLNHSYQPGLHCHIPKSFVITIYDPEDGFIVFLRKVLTNQTTLHHAPQKRKQIMKLPISRATSFYVRTVPVRLVRWSPCELQQQGRSYCNFNEQTETLWTYCTGEFNVHSKPRTARPLLGSSVGLHENSSLPNGLLKYKYHSNCSCQ